MNAGVIFPISPELSDQIQELIDRVEEDPHHGKRHTDHLLEVLNQLCDVGVTYYFVEMARRIKVGPIGMKVVTVGVKSMLTAMKMVNTQIIKTLSDEQIVLLIRFVEEWYILLEEDWTVKE